MELNSGKVDIVTGTILIHRLQDTYNEDAYILLSIKYNNTPGYITKLNSFRLHS